MAKWFFNSRKTALTGLKTKKVPVPHSPQVGKPKQTKTL